MPTDAKPPLPHEPASEELRFDYVEGAAITDQMAREMVAHFRAAFGPWPRHHPDVDPVAYLRWKASGPASRIASLQGRIGGRLAYATIAFASWVRVGGVRRLRLSFLDASVDPELRGRGVFTRAVAHQEANSYRCDFSMHERSVAAEVRTRLARRDQRPLGNRVKPLSRVLRPSAALSLHHGRRLVLAAPATTAQWVLGGLLAAGRRDRGLRPRTVARFDRRFDELFEAAAGGFDMIAERTAEFLSWRYGDPRGGRHVTRELVEGNRSIGYAVLRVAEQRAYLADLLVLPDHSAALEALLADAVGIARTSGAAVLECWLPRRHPYRPSLRRLGFFGRGRDLGVSFHPVEAQASELAVLEDPHARIHYTPGDTDLV